MNEQDPRRKLSASQRLTEMSQRLGVILQSEGLSLERRILLSGKKVEIDDLLRPFAPPLFQGEVRVTEGEGQSQAVITVPREEDAIGATLVKVEPPTTPYRITRMRAILEDGHGIIFHPKRRAVKISVPDVRSISTLVESEDVSEIQGWISGVMDYIEGEAISDPWTDEKRRVKREELFQKYGDVFNEVYRKPNQLTVANMGAITGACYALSFFIGKKGVNRELARYFNGKGDSLKVEASNYSQKSLREKFIVVRHYEDAGIELLGRVYGVSQTRVMMVT